MNINVPAEIRFTAEIDNVKEAVIAGRADLSYWTDILSRYDIRPADTNGYAEILAGAAELKWKGIKFREFTISISVVEDNSSDKGYYLIQAFNSVSILSLSERLFFSTPYSTAGIMLNLGVTPGTNLVYKKNEMFKAFAAHPSDILSEGDDTWSGKVYLPGSGRKYFIAVLSGNVKRLSFTESKSTLAIQPLSTFPVFDSLLNSGFDPYEWRLRESAVHKKSKTYSGELL